MILEELHNTRKSHMHRTGLNRMTRAGCDALGNE